MEAKEGVVVNCCKYLVVDDDTTFRERLLQALAKRGCDAFGVGTVDEAFAALQGGKYQRIILDLKMPGRNGLELLERLAEGPILENANRLEVVVLTGYGSIATTLTALKLGAVNYLTKPVSLQQILAAFEGKSPAAAVENIKTISTPSLSQVEWEHIQRVMRDCGGNVSQAAKMLGLHRRSLQRKLQKQP